MNVLAKRVINAALFCAIGFGVISVTQAEPPADVFVRTDGYPNADNYRADNFPRHADVDRSAEGDTVLLMTDGLVEALDPDGEPFGYDRVQDCFASSASGPAQAVIDALLSSAEAHLAGNAHQDDMTFVVFRATG